MILVVPMCLLCSTIGVALAGMDINIFVQIGFIVLVGLASKNAILIVEFAKEKSAKVRTPARSDRRSLPAAPAADHHDVAGVHSRRLPLALAVGAGAEMRRTLGIAVFSGMLGVTLFGILLTPVFYYVVVRLFGQRSPMSAAAGQPSNEHLNATKREIPYYPRAAFTSFVSVRSGPLRNLRSIGAESISRFRLASASSERRGALVLLRH